MRPTCNVYLGSYIRGELCLTLCGCALLLIFIMCLIFRREICSLNNKLIHSIHFFLEKLEMLNDVLYKLFLLQIRKMRRQQKKYYLLMVEKQSINPGLLALCLFSG